MTTASANGRWELRHTDNFTQNAAGYGNGSWRYELVECATGRIVRTWTGTAQTSPWDAASTGVRSIAWDGDELVILDEDGTEQRVNPATGGTR